MLSDAVGNLLNLTVVVIPQRSFLGHMLFYVALTSHILFYYWCQRLILFSMLSEI